MHKKIKVSELVATIKKELEEYEEDAQDIMKKAVKEAGESARKQLKETSPGNTGKYAKSWAVKTVKESTSEMSVVVHSRNRYYLTHLLEKGHAKRGGGRTAAQIHIAPVEEDVTKKFVRDIKEKLG